MLKFITSAVVASSFALTASQEVFAGGDRSCAPAPARQVQRAAPAVPSAVPGTPQKAPTPPATAQNTRSQYRSYSYDRAPIYRAPAVRSYRSQNNWQEYQFRADRKLRGL